MKRILVTTDFSTASQAAFSVAREYAELFGIQQTKVYLLCVLEDIVPLSVQFEFGLPMVDSKAILDEAYKQASQKIKDLRHTSFEDFNVETEVLRATNPIHTEIVEFASKQDIDLIILATHGRTGAKRLMLGSVSERVVREAPCPVLVVPVPPSS